MPGIFADAFNLLTEIINIPLGREIGKSDLLAFFDQFHQGFPLLPRKVNGFKAV